MVRRYGAVAGRGCVFKLRLAGSRYDGTHHASIYVDDDGVWPYAGLTFGKDGALYGTTSFGGSNRGARLQVDAGGKIALCGDGPL